MNFIEAALTVLKESRKTLSTEELTERAEKLLSKPGKDPQRSLKAALGREVSKGEESRVVQVGEDRWRLAKGAQVPAPAQAAKKAPAASKTAEKAKASKTGKAAEKDTKAGKDAKAGKPASPAGKDAKAGAKDAKASKPGKAAPAKEAKAADKPAAKKKPAVAEAPAQADTGKGKPDKSRTPRRGKKPVEPAAVAQEAPEIIEEPVVEPVTASEPPVAAQAEPAEIVAEESLQAVVQVVAVAAEPTGTTVAEAVASVVERQTPAGRPGSPGAPALPEDELAELYGDELSGTTPGAAFAEYRDSQTEDEDRPMMPEIVASRRERQRLERMERRKRRREQRRQGRDGGRDGGRELRETRDVARPERELREGREGRELRETRDVARPERELREGREGRELRETRDVARPEREIREGREAREPVRSHEPVRGRVERAAEPTPVLQPEAVVPAAVMPAAPVAAPVASDVRVAAAAELPFYRPGNALADAAVEIMRGFRNSQPVAIKQLVHLMRKRQLITGNPEELWAHVKTALIADEQAYLAAGLAPRVVYRGRDQFAPGTGPASPALAAAQAEVERAVMALHAATHAALRERLCSLSRDVLEQVVHVYLLRQGWQNIQWIKHVERLSYGLADAPDGRGTVLVGLCAGAEPVDRRGVGMLRVGVVAKQVPSGFLLAPQELAESARAELRRNGPSLSLLVGDGFVAALARAGIGVVAAQTPTLYLDDRFFSELDAE